MPAALFLKDTDPTPPRRGGENRTQRSNRRLRPWRLAQSPRHHATAALLLRLWDAARNAPVFGSRLTATHSPSPPKRSSEASYSLYARPSAASSAGGNRPFGTRTVSTPVVRSVSDRKKSGELIASSTVIPNRVTFKSPIIVRACSPEPIEAKPSVGRPSL